MKFLLVLLAVVGAVVAYNTDIMGEEDWKNFFEDESISPEERGLILNGQGKKMIKNIMEQMPCGWPQYGIPPLDPYTNSDLKVHLTESVVDALLQALRFRFEGISNMEVKKFKLSYLFGKKIQFDFNFPEIKATSRTLNTDTLVDLLRQLGIAVRYEGSGPLSFSLDNLRLTGSMKYKAPLIFGSIQIYNFEIVVSLGGVRSHIGGILGNGRINEAINDEIDYAIPAIINGYQPQISATIANIFEPAVNKMLKGKKLFSLLGLLGGSSEKCVPEPAPWFAEEN